ncbi:hypothetical protein [Aquimarina mytili]|uniref:Uncharacterized protein n=1 Tax=Aquimarina mytili TaxID=874423 RepID=A0A937A0D6_9FLAO|nr:hypothetical protein [Aquimarina mytili]MBL0685200.1 hypothetical protein [Aquimarina mytili]
MKKLIFITLLSFFSAQGQENIKDIVVGDILTVGAPSAMHYKHIYFPKTNFIIKKGGIPNYKALIGNRVIVTGVDKKDGYTKISFKKDDGRKFFNSITIVNANLEEALKEKEILLAK